MANDKDKNNNNDDDNDNDAGNRNHNGNGDREAELHMFGDDNTFTFSVNLLEHSKQHISFLTDLHSLGVTLQRPSSISLQRYRDRWLPLIYHYQYSNNKNNSSSNNNSKLIPPPDVAWLFHCHRLAPYRYAKFCRKTFGITDNRQIPDANPPFSFQLESGKVHCGTQTESEHTRSLWKQLYPDEPFFLREGTEETVTELQKQKSASTSTSSSTSPYKGRNETEYEDHSSSSSLLLDGFDLLGSTDRQSTFLWQVSGPRFSDDEFLKDGIGRYHKFILLRKRVLDDRRQRTQQQHGDVNAPPRNLGIIVPTYQIDLMWHTHMLSGLGLYHKDCKSLLGHGMTLNHDDGLNDRTEGGTLDVAFKETKEFWKDSYGESYCVRGGMYRGEPPKQYYSTDWDKAMDMDVLYPLSCAARNMNMNMNMNMLHEHEQGASSINETENNVNYQKFDEQRADRTRNYELTGVAVAAAVADHADVDPPQRVPGGQAWTPLSGYAPDGSPGFLEPRPRSRKRYTNANPRRKNYVFGIKGLRAGYFHITTKEAYEVLEQRAKVHARSKEQELALMQCCTLGLCSNSRSMKHKEEGLNKVRDVELIARKRAASTGPDAAVELPERLQTNKTHVSRDGRWHFPESYYSAGGGCGYYNYTGAGYDFGGDAGACGGGGGGDGGGVLGAGCGAGGCGGGGCGGGGCGGGGCGGGGCGG